jgi:3-oxoacyl-[acyl-carrier protein] reductase
VVVNFRESPGKASEVADEIVKSGSEALAVKGDVRCGREMEAMMTATVDQWGRIDVLVNNAGRTSDGLLIRMPERDWDSVMETNLGGAFHAIRAAARFMELQGSGHIINIASIVGQQGREGQANYAAAKAGLIGLTKAAASELGGYNIQVNAVLPGYLATDMGQTVTAEAVERIRSRHVLNRFSDPDEVAAFIHHLSRMRNVSGQVFNLDSRII